MIQIKQITGYVLIYSILKHRTLVKCNRGSLRVSREGKTPRVFQHLGTYGRVVSQIPQISAPTGKRYPVKSGYQCWVRTRRSQSSSVSNRNYEIHGQGGSCWPADLPKETKDLEINSTCVVGRVQSLSFSYTEIVCLYHECTA